MPNVQLASDEGAQPILASNGSGLAKRIALRLIRLILVQVGEAAQHNVRRVCSYPS